MKIEESIHINRPAEEVFAFFDNRNNDHRWMASVEESEWLEPGESTRLGRRGRMVMRAMGRHTFDDVVTGYEPGQRVEHLSDSGSMVVRTACIAEPEGTGCRATVTYEPVRLPGGWFGRMIEPLTSRIIRHNFRADLARLKDILETEG